MHALRATFQIARIFQSCALIAVIGLAANFIAEIVKINAKPPSILIGTITVTSIAVLYCILTSIILLDNVLPLLYCAVIDTLLMTALIVVAVIIGRPFSYLQCAGIPSLMRRDDDTSAYAFATRLSEYLSNLNGGKVDYGSWIGISREVCLEAKSIWGLSIGLCVLFFFSAACSGYLWRMKKKAATGVEKLDG
ncbi:uncharacterized protein ASPGLDRAFT_47724 [Aspergillus glaucus CBS 516.65]|uniref:MARVEL domain-containing protein n=1 Tax=Aspergillus glaucus CBS 516.65 TaxID=1160497 RepID=A0A1L9VJD4_ASPGL|nr:hypothetical protein ASPGLDRAFT_47724 [Aspergillus glaucus CBS 516.65]OJJ84003.1 hypothetical protein ASPGLDRAFT_47724 [Aspergillus glaucus CBS 516.65]